METKASTIQIINKTFWGLVIAGSDQQYTIDKYSTVEVPWLIGKVQVKLAAPFGWFWKATLTEASKGGPQNLTYEFQYSFKNYKRTIIFVIILILLLLLQIFRTNSFLHKTLSISLLIALGITTLIIPEYGLIKTEKE